ncbi:MAG: DnaD domain protein [Chloroflexota bacterium]
MSDAFNGFGGRDKPVHIPETFFSELLPLIDDLAELKVTLFCMWAMQQREGHYRYLTLPDFTGDSAFMAGLAVIAPDQPAEQTLQHGLACAVQRGTLITAEVTRADETMLTLYLMNTARGREAREAIAQGNWTDTPQVEILPPRPTIYRLYEQEIGALTPMIADELKDMEQHYLDEWIRDAVRVAVREQKRHIRYIAAVLERWREEGKTDDGTTGQQESMGHHGDREAIRRGGYSDFFER